MERKDVSGRQRNEKHTVIGCKLELVSHKLKKYPRDKTILYLNLNDR
jgi:hypothetical protein